MESSQALAEATATELGIGTDAPASEPTTEPAPAAAEPSPQPAAYQQPESPRPAERLVPLSTLMAERQRWRQQAQETAELKAQIEAIKAAQAPKPVPPPDPLAEPLEYLKWQEDRRKAGEAEHETKAQAEARERQEAEHREAIENLYFEAADEAREMVPDFDDAYLHLTRWGEAQLKAQGYRNPKQRAEILAQEELKLVTAALQAGYNPAEVIYRKAWQYGYQGRQQLPMPQQQTLAPPVAPPAPTPPRDPATGQFQPAAPTRQAPKSLSSVPGVPGGQALDGTSIADMDTAEFDRLFLSGGREAWRKVHKGK